MRSREKKRKTCAKRRVRIAFKRLRGWHTVETRVRAAFVYGIVPMTIVVGPESLSRATIALERISYTE